MKVSLLTDAPKHNLALMKLSAAHKKLGHEVLLNMPLWDADIIYVSELFDKTNIPGHIKGGPKNPKTALPPDIESMRPDYDLYNLDYSLGYTYRPCWRKCDFCKVGEMNHPDTLHHSIWEFHDKRFSKICLLNNNTFADNKWADTFAEIWDADLIVIDENGYDLRLLSDCKVAALKKTKFEGKLHFAWDRMQDESEILAGLELLKKHKVTGSVYVLIGYDTTEDDDLYRCQKIVDIGHTPYIMPYNQSKPEKRFKRFIDSFMWRKYKTLKKAWSEYD